MTDKTSVSVELLPCPFCGSRNVAPAIGSSRWIVVYSCYDCRAIGAQAAMKHDDIPSVKLSKALVAWNRRAPVLQPPEESAAEPVAQQADLRSAHSNECAGPAVQGLSTVEIKGERYRAYDDSVLWAEFLDVQKDERPNNHDCFNGLDPYCREYARHAFRFAASTLTFRLTASPPPSAEPISPAAPVCSMQNAVRWGELILDASGKAHFVTHTTDTDFIAMREALKKFIDLLQRQLDEGAKCPYYKEPPAADLDATPMWDAMVLSVHGGMTTDGADGVTADEDYYSKSHALGQDLERDRNRLLRENKFLEGMQAPLRSTRLALIERCEAAERDLAAAKADAASWSDQCAERVKDWDAMRIRAEAAEAAFKEAIDAARIQQAKEKT